MGKYRWYLLNSVLWCYAYDLVLTLWKPVFLGASLGGYANSFIPLNYGTQLILAGVGITCVIHSGLGVAMEIMYRSAQVRSNELLYL